VNDKLHIADTDLTLYAIGALLLAEAKPIEAHLATCAQCKEELRQIMLATAAYAQTTPPVELPAGAQNRFMARLAQTPQTQGLASAKPEPASPARSSQASQSPVFTSPASTSQPPASQIPPSQFPPSQQKPPSLWEKLFGSSWSPVLAAAFALLLVAVGVDDLHKRAQIAPLLQQARHGAIDSAQLNQLMELLTSPQAKRVALHPGPVAAPPPEGRVVYAERTGKLLLTASNLHPLPAGKTYELWILQPGGKAPLPAGTFAPDSKGNAEMILADEPAGLAVAGFGVTIENTGGSQTPTLPIVLSGL
jgi:anti-sigma-K factor RskA